MSPQYGELRPTSGWDLFGSLGHPGYFQRLPRLGSVTARHVVLGVSQTLRRWTEGPAPPMFGRATITLGIGPQSSFRSFIVCHIRQILTVEQNRYYQLFITWSDYSFVVLWSRRFASHAVVKMKLRNEAKKLHKDLLFWLNLVITPETIHIYYKIIPEVESPVCRNYKIAKKNSCYNSIPGTKWL